VQPPCGERWSWLLDGRPSEVSSRYSVNRTRQSPTLSILSSSPSTHSSKLDSIPHRTIVRQGCIVNLLSHQLGSVLPPHSPPSPPASTSLPTLLDIGRLRVSTLVNSRTRGEDEGKDRRTRGCLDAVGVIGVGARILSGHCVVIECVFSMTRVLQDARECREPFRSQSKVPDFQFDAIKYLDCLGNVFWVIAKRMGDSL
jgi:hypothetical protein